MRDRARFRGLARGLSHSSHGIPQADGVFVLRGVPVAEPAVLRGIALAEKADDACGRAVDARPPEAEALAGKEVPAADGAHRHRRNMVGPAPDGQA